MKFDFRELIPTQELKTRHAEMDSRSVRLFSSRIGKSNEFVRVIAAREAVGGKQVGYLLHISVSVGLAQSNQTRRPSDEVIVAVCNLFPKTDLIEDNSGGENKLIRHLWEVPF